MSEEEPRRRLRICYVLATAAAGTGYHAAMLAEGADKRGMRVAVRMRAPPRRRT